MVNSPTPDEPPADNKKGEAVDNSNDFKKVRREYRTRGNIIAPYLFVANLSALFSTFCMFDTSHVW